MSLPPLTSTPISQLSVEQPSVKKTRIYQKRSSTTKDTKEGQQRDEQEEWTTMQSSPELDTQELEGNYTAEVLSHGTESSESYAGLPSLGVLHQEEELPEHLAFKASGV